MPDFAGKTWRREPLGGPRRKLRVSLNHSANYVVRVNVSPLKLLHVFSVHLHTTEMLQ